MTDNNNGIGTHPATTLEPHAAPGGSAAALREFLRFALRGAPFALALALLAGGAAYTWSSRVPPTYSASATLLVSQPDAVGASLGGSLITSPPTDAATFRVALNSSELLGATARRLALPVEQPVLAALESALTLRAQESRTSTVLYVDALAGSATAAAERANAAALVLIDWDRARASRGLEQIQGSLEAQIESLEAQLAVLRAQPDADASQREALANLRDQRLLQLNTARALAGSAVGRLELLEPALAPLRPTNGATRTNTVLAALLGLAFGYGLMLLRSAFRTRLDDPEELAAVAGAPLLAQFRKTPKSSRTLGRESASYLRTNLLFAMRDVDPKVILVTGASSGQGKSSVALALAESFARGGQRTLLIDGDLRQPALGRRYRLDPLIDTSFQKHLETRDKILPITTVTVGGGATMDLVPGFAPAPEPAELLGRNLRRLVEFWEKHYEVIVFDSAPVLPVADALAVAPYCSGALLVARAGHEDRRRLDAASGLLKRVGVRVFGVVATGVDARDAVQGYPAGYGMEVPLKTKETSSAR